MDYIQKIEIQTEKITQAKPLEKHIILISCPVTVDDYDGHIEEYLQLGGDYNDGFTPLNKIQK